MMSELKQLKAADGFECTAYIARPPGKARAAVVVVQEIFGLNSHIRAVADGYAEQGYLAIAPAAFERVRAGIELGYGTDDIEHGRGLKAAVEALPAPGVMADIAAAIAYGAASTGAHVGIVGYCWGGLLVWRSACTLAGLSAAVAYYGGGMTSETEAARQPACPVMCHFGELDHAIAIDGVRAFERAQPALQVHVYGAGHGFNCDQRGSYDAAAAALARERSLAFFEQHLGRA